MADTGANVCLTYNTSILVNITDIPPIPLGVANSQPTTAPSMCTQQGFLPIPLTDGSFHYQPFLINPHATDTILSPAHVMRSCDKIFGWCQSGSKHQSTSDTLTFTDADDTPLLVLPLTTHNGLQYCSPSTGDDVPHSSTVRSTITYTPPATLPPSHAHPPTPIGVRRVLESELWAARLGFCGEWQLTQIPHHSTGTPSKFFPHPLRFVEHKEQARIRKRAARSTSTPARLPGQRFSMDFGFIRSSNSDYTGPTPSTSRVVESFDGYVAYLLIVDEASRYVWVFLRKSKEPPTELVSHFLQLYGRKSGGVIRCDQGGELARSHLFRSTLMDKHLYVLEPTGADSPSQNGGSEKWNDTLAVTTRALLYGASLPAKYWSAALTHAAYIHNRRVHRIIQTTPYEKWFGHQPDLRLLCIFGSRVCVKRTGDRRAKLDKHDFLGIFIGYTATDSNIRYIDVASGIVKTSHHAVFDKCWFHQPWRPPAAQLLYDLGTQLIGTQKRLQHKIITDIGLDPTPPDAEPDSPDLDTSPDILPTTSSLEVAMCAIYSASLPHPTNMDTAVVDHYDISKRDVEQVYFSFSDDCFGVSFEESFVYGSATMLHPTAGLILDVRDDRLYITDIVPGTPCAKIPRWRTRLKNTWLFRINNSAVSTISDVTKLLDSLPHAARGICRLLVRSADLRDGLTNEGIPQLSLVQLNPRHFFAIPPDVSPLANWVYKSWDGGVLQYLTRASKLTCGTLLKQHDWDDWQQAEFLQLDQYDLQNMFGDPVVVSNTSAIFNLVWTYAIKEVDGRKKARCTCDGSTRGGQVRVLDFTYANSPDHTCSRIFYAISAAENLLIFGADVSNAFAEAPPPKQGFYIRPDPAFRAWWTTHKGRPPLPHNAVIPILSAMQGHPESPRLWEKHADRILCTIGLTPTNHKPCLYSGVINQSRVFFLRQVDDFAIASTTPSIAAHVLDLIEEHLTIPLKRLGLVSLFNGIDIAQTENYIKISCSTYINRICEKYLDTWLRSHNLPNRATPLPQHDTFLKSFLTSVGDPSPHVQEELSNRMGIKYRNGIGELIYALVTCRPDISYALVKCAQSTVTPHEVHYHALRHLLKYLYVTQSDGIYYWCHAPNTSLPHTPNPVIVSSPSSILHQNRPIHDALDLHGYVDSDWATCPRTRRSLTGVCLRLAGGTIAYKTKLQPTVAQSSTEAEFMGASDFGKILLYVRSILWDLGIPQHAASVLYEDNDACTAMAMAQKPTSRTRHMDIKYHVICEWVEQDLLTLKRIDTTINMADLFTKSLGPTLF